jgi:hypothetical protein
MLMSQQMIEEIERLLKAGFIRTGRSNTQNGYLPCGLRLLSLG